MALSGRRLSTVIRAPTNENLGNREHGYHLLPLSLQHRGHGVYSNLRDAVGRRYQSAAHHRALGGGRVEDATHAAWSRWRSEHEEAGRTKRAREDEPQFLVSSGGEAEHKASALTPLRKNDAWLRAASTGCGTTGRTR